MKSLVSLILLIVFAVCQICLARENFDVEILPSFRTQQYSLGSYKQIIVFSAPRTGSSLVYNICRFIFEEESKLFFNHNDFRIDKKVLKTHRFAELDLLEDENVLFVFTIRDPLDASISNYRICPRHIIDNKAFAKELTDRHRRYLVFSEKLKAEGKNVVWLKFEDFMDNLDYILESIENHFCISIDLPDKELIKKGYSKQNIFRCTEHLESFNEYLPISGFHGRHVNLGEYSPPEDFVYWLNVYLESEKELFNKYGYGLGAG